MDILKLLQIPEGGKLTQAVVDRFIDRLDVAKLDDKTTMVKATLVNGFVVVETSSCVDPADYNEEIGRDICINRILNKVWELLGFLVQTAKNGISMTKIPAPGKVQEVTCLKEKKQCLDDMKASWPEGTEFPTDEELCKICGKCETAETPQSVN